MAQTTTQTHMENANLQLPVVTALDAAIQAIAALCYLIVGTAAWIRAPHDVRTRVFAALAITNALAFIVPAAAWRRGVTEFERLSRLEIAAILCALAVGALLLFHFTQVLPRRRPWLRGSGVQLPAAYVLAPAILTALVWYFPATAGQLSAAYVLVVLVFGFPLLILLTLVLPITGIISLVKSYHEARTAGLTHIATVIAWIVVSQIAGGTLAIVFAPVLATLAPNSASQTALTIVIWALGLITPIAFALAIWKYDLLTVDPEA